MSTAVQLFREVPAGIHSPIRIGKLTAKAEETACFFKLLWKWYSLMSLCHSVLALSKIDVGKYEEAISTLCLAQHTLRRVKMGMQTGSQLKKACRFQQPSHLASQKRFCEYGYMYILTSRLLQDCQENISILRMKKPTASTYNCECALKLVCVGQFLHTPKLWH